MENFTKLSDRIKQFIDYKGITINKFSVSIGASNSYFNKILRDNNSVGSDRIEKILRTYPEINPVWLMLGDGEMLQSKSKEKANKENVSQNVSENVSEPNVKKMSTNEEVQMVAEPRQKNNLIPLYDGLVAAGSNFQVDLSPQMEPVEYVDAGDWFRDATAAMRVHGDSMHPEYKSGSIIAMKEVNEKRLIVYGQDYVVETSEYRVLKRLQRADEKQFWTLASVNMEVWEAGPLKGRLIHEPFEVHVDDVSRLFKVLGCVKRNESSRIVYNNG